MHPKLISILSIISVVQCIIVNPKIFVPNNQTVWYVGCQADIAWDTSQIVTTGPLQTETSGPIMLGYIIPPNPSEHLFLTLVPNVNLTLGFAHITVPNVPTRNDYIVVVFGDSGNASPPFTIRRGNRCCGPPGPPIRLPPP